MGEEQFLKKQLFVLGILDYTEEDFKKLVKLYFQYLNGDKYEAFEKAVEFLIRKRTICKC